jgi:uncharacterized protein (TIGR03083 family)
VTAGEQRIADLDLFDLLDTEAERCAEFLSSEPDWSAPTRCEGWNVRDMLSHFAGVETYHLACLDDAIGALFEEAGKDGVNDFNSFNDWIVRKRAEMSTDEVFEEWRTKNLEVRRRMRELGRDGSMSSSVGPYPVGLMAAHIASEYATHADDMDVEIPDAEQAGRAAWRRKVSLFAIEEAQKDVTVSERGPDEFVVRSGDKEAVLHETDFVEAVTARLGDDHPLDPELRAALRALA